MNRVAGVARFQGLVNFWTQQNCAEMGARQSVALFYCTDTGDSLASDAHEEVLEYLPTDLFNWDCCHPSKDFSAANLQGRKGAKRRSPPPCLVSSSPMISYATHVASSARVEPARMKRHAAKLTQESQFSAREPGRNHICFSISKLPPSGSKAQLSSILDDSEILLESIATNAGLENSSRERILLLSHTDGRIGRAALMLKAQRPSLDIRSYGLITAAASKVSKVTRYSPHQADSGSPESNRYFKGTQSH